LATRFVCGDFRDYQTVVEFCQQVEFVTIEIEQVNTEALKFLEMQGKKVFPQPQVVEMIKDKAIQKQFYLNHGIPTSEFRLIESKKELKDLPDVFFPCFQKSRKDGYDGKGVLSLKNKEAIDKGFDTPSIVEKAVNVSKEFAMFGSGDGRGECVLFPAVEMEFHPEANLVEYLVMPADLSEDQINAAQEIVKKIFKATNLRGLLAVEFFLSHSGDILVNEMAPRPHNSGHTSIEGNYSNQFAEHLRAVLGWPAGNTNLRNPSVMINLLGEEGFQGPAKFEGLQKVLAQPGVYLHLYGKAITKPFRKMGHITVLGNTVEQAREKAQMVRSSIRIIS
jgi:5-(carboxyamino)imidazole ribonucleotide synthase